MAALTPVTVSRAGVSDASGAAASAGGDTFTNDGMTMLLAKNASGGAITITIAVGQTVDGQTVTSKTVSVPASQTMLIGPFPLAIYTDPATGNVAFTYSAVTSLTVKAIKFQA